MWEVGQIERAGLLGPPLLARAHVSLPSHGVMARGEQTPAEPVLSELGTVGEGGARDWACSSRTPLHMFTHLKAFFLEVPPFPDFSLPPNLQF